jgi:hypothetical protein
MTATDVDVFICKICYPSLVMVRRILPIHPRRQEAIITRHALVLLATLTLGCPAPIGTGQGDHILDMDDHRRSANDVVG